MLKNKMLKSGKQNLCETDTSISVLLLLVLLDDFCKFICYFLFALGEVVKPSVN